MSNQNLEPKTADGYPFAKGDKVWVQNCHGEPEPYQVVVGNIFSNKILYAEETNGFIGAKRSIVFHLKENAYWKDDEC